MVGWMTKAATLALVFFCFIPCVVGDWNISDDWLFGYEGPLVNVVFTVGTGGLLMVNGSSVSNGETVSYANASTIVIAAVPTDSSYSFSAFNLNGSSSTVNPVSYVLIGDSDLANQTVTVTFSADDLSSDDAIGATVILAVVFMCIPLAFVLNSKRED